MERDIILVLDLFEDDGNLYSNEDFLKVKTFPVKYREFAFRWVPQVWLNK